MDSRSQDRSGILPGMASNDQDLPTPIAEMSTAMHEAIERARACAAQWIDQRDRMAQAVDEYPSTRALPAVDLPGAVAPEIGID